MRQIINKLKGHLNLTFEITCHPPEPCLGGGIREPRHLEPELDLCLCVLLVAVNILHYHHILYPDTPSPEGAGVTVLIRQPLASVAVRPPRPSDGLRALVDTKQLLPEDGLKGESGDHNELFGNLIRLFGLTL